MKTHNSLLEAYNKVYMYISNFYVFYECQKSQIFLRYIHLKFIKLALKNKCFVVCKSKITDKFLF